MSNDLIKLALGYAHFLRGNVTNAPLIASTSEEMVATFEALALRLGEAEARAEKAEAAIKTARIQALKDAAKMIWPEESDPSFTTRELYVVGFWDGRRYCARAIEALAEEEAGE